MGRFVDSIVSQGDERRMLVDNNTVAVTGCLGKSRSLRLQRQVDLSMGDRDLVGGNDC